MEWNAFDWNGAEWNAVGSYSAATEGQSICIDAEAIWEIEIDCEVPDCYMASKIHNITNVTRGNDETLRFNIVTKTALNRAWLVIKRHISDLDSISKLITGAAGPDGRIVNAGGGGNKAVAEFKLLKSETNWIQSNTEYRYDVEVFDTSNNASTPVGGKIIIEDRVRQDIG